MSNIENNAVEWKEVWDKDWLKGISGFATFNGGTYLIGVRDDGEYIGVKSPEKLMKSISDTIRNSLGISPDVECIEVGGKSIIRIDIHHSVMPVDCDGKYYKRIGNTFHEIRGSELSKLLLERNNMTWTDQELENYREEGLSNDSLEYVCRKGKARGNIPVDAECDLQSMLDNLELRGRNGSMTIAAAALFSKQPNIFAPGTYIKIGKFDRFNELIGEDVVNGPLAMQPELAVDILFKKYIRNRYVYGDLFRDVKFEYSNRALREAVLNACIHKDYLKGNPVFIKVRPDCIEIFNEGGLPESWTYEDFVSENHNSLPPNRKIANVFHKMGLIEHWGRGIRLMIEECRKDGSKLPEFTVDKHGITVKFFSMLGSEEPVASANDELTDFERRVFDAIATGSMTKVGDIVEVTGVSLGSVSRALSSLKAKCLIVRTGTNRNGLWVVVRKT